VDQADQVDLIRKMLKMLLSPLTKMILVLHKVKWEAHVDSTQNVTTLISAVELELQHQEVKPRTTFVETVEDQLNLSPSDCKSLTTLVKQPKLWLQLDQFLLLFT
jgi:hypothetical protein